MKAAEAKAWWVPWIEALPSAVWGLVSGLVVLYAGSRMLHHWQKRLEQKQKTAEKVGDHNAAKFLEASDKLVDVCYDLIDCALQEIDHPKNDEVFCIKQIGLEKIRHRLITELTGRIAPMGEEDPELKDTFRQELARILEGPPSGDKEEIYAYMDEMQTLLILIPQIHRALREAKF